MELVRGIIKINMARVRSRGRGKIGAVMGRSLGTEDASMRSGSKILIMFYLCIYFWTCINAMRI